MKSYILNNLANILTFARMLLLPIIIGLFYLEESWGGFAMFLAFILYILAAITDYFDGFVARKFNQVTAFGTFFDPISDKIFVSTLLLMLVAANKITGVWILLVILIFAREFLVSGLREYLGPKNISIPVTKLAKYKTAAQMGAIAFLIISGYSPFAHEFGLILLSLATLLTVVTGAQYVYKGLKHL
jgi:cardiolipin synthase